MLREIPGVRQDKPDLRRRWYQDEYFDLYTWHAQAGRPAAFQLCYDTRARARNPLHANLTSVTATR